MYLKEVIIKNYGSIENLLLTPSLNEDGNPMPIVLVGKNGTGKTLLLMNILNSTLNIISQKMVKLGKLKSAETYREKTKSYIQSGKNHSYMHISYEGDGKYAEFIELTVNERNEFLASIDDVSTFKEFDKFDANFVKNNHFKKIMDNMSEEWLNNNVFLYFPAYRYYKPSWLRQDNNETSLDFFKEREESTKELSEKIIKVDVLKDIEEWILNLILDRYLYETKLQVRTIAEKDIDNKEVNKEIVEQLGFEGKNNTTISLINNLLNIIYKKKFDDFEYARLGISKKNKRKVSIIVKQKSKKEMQLAPTFSHLSSGEAMLISIFCSILKQHDLNNEKGIEDLSQIKGIVIIDEVDLNLNLVYAKEILPELIAAFKGIQFILASHSPFFLLGMKQTFKNNCSIINISDGDSFNHKDIYNELEKCYNIFVEKAIESIDYEDEINGGANV